MMVYFFLWAIIARRLLLLRCTAVEQTYRASAIVLLSSVLKFFNRLNALSASANVTGSAQPLSSSTMTDGRSRFCANLYAAGAESVQVSFCSFLHKIRKLSFSGWEDMSWTFSKFFYHSRPMIPPAVEFFVQPAPDYFPVAALLLSYKSPVMRSSLYHCLSPYLSLVIPHVRDYCSWRNVQKLIHSLSKSESARHFLDKHIYNKRMRGTWNYFHTASCGNPLAYKHQRFFSHTILLRKVWSQTQRTAYWEVVLPFTLSPRLNSEHDIYNGCRQLAGTLKRWCWQLLS